MVGNDSGSDIENVSSSNWSEFDGVCITQAGAAGGTGHTATATSCDAQPASAISDSSAYPLKPSKAVVLDPARNFGKAILTSAGIDTATLYQAFQAEGQNSKRVAMQFEIPITVLDTAIAYEAGITAHNPRSRIS